MRYVVLDLEWNQPVSYNSAVFRSIGDRLMFEVIQIGAVRLDAELIIEDAICLPVKPAHYTSIHPRIRRMTHLGADELENAPGFLEAMDKLAEFCGEDFALLTWGCDDISVLRQNMDFFGFDRELPGMYDVQKRYASVMGLGGNQQVGLKSAMENLQITPDETRFFHNALNDAYYTALVFQRLPEPEKVLEFSQTPKKLNHPARRCRFRVTHIVPSVKEALGGASVLSPACPACKKPTQLQTPLIPQAPGKYVALSSCPRHGLILIKIRFSLLPDGRKGMYLSVLPANRQSKAYVHTKQLQYEYRKKRGDYDDFDMEDLSLAAMGSNMPFDDG